jgi:hypothetical protein
MNDKFMREDEIKGLEKFVFSLVLFGLAVCACIAGWWLYDVS